MVKSMTGYGRARKTLKICGVAAALHPAAASQVVQLFQRGNVALRQRLVDGHHRLRPEGYEVFSSGCGGDNMCGRLACTYLLCNLCGCGGMPPRFPRSCWMVW